MADKKPSAREEKLTLEEALKHPGAVLMEDSIKASKERVTAHNDAMVAAGAINGTTAAAPSGSTAVSSGSSGTAPAGNIQITGG